MRPILLMLMLSSAARGYVVPHPPISLATGLPNRSYEWREQHIRYQVCGDPAGHPVVLVHGLFVNSDHWRHTIKGLGEAGYRVYAVDLLGSGYSSKPMPWDDQAATLVNGEQRRFLDDECLSSETETTTGTKTPSILKNIRLGTANGGSRTADVPLRHPLGSPYNFYTWAEQVADFTRDIVLKDNKKKKVTLISNSKGTIVSLQAAIDSPELYDGVFLLNPTFREMHSAEAPKLMMPVIRRIQGLLRRNGLALFKSLARPNIVKKILREPYAVASAVDDELVDALLSPLLTPGAPEVVFDTLSYSAGPLPEQQLSSSQFPSSIPVWLGYGTNDPWTPGARVRSMGKLDTVERVIPLKGLGHCPHDEAPHIINPLLINFLERVDETSRVKKEHPLSHLIVPYVEGIFSPAFAQACFA